MMKAGMKMGKSVFICAIFAIIAIITAILFTGCSENKPSPDRGSQSSTPVIGSDITDDTQRDDTQSDDDTGPAEDDGFVSEETGGQTDITSNSPLRIRENNSGSGVSDDAGVYRKTPPAVVDNIVSKNGESEKIVPQYEVKRICDVLYGQIGDKKLLLDMYLPNKSGTMPILVFFHGGELESGNKESLADLAWEFASQGIGVVTPSYRLYPDADYPDFIDDAARSVAWVQQNITKYASSDGIFVGGHSAGAYLAYMLCFDGSYLAEYSVDAGSIKGYICASGSPATPGAVLKYRGDDPDSDIIDDAAPLYHVMETGMPLLVLCADNDVSGRLEQTHTLIDKIKQLNYISECTFTLMNGYTSSSYLESVNGCHSALFLSAREFIARHIYS